MTLSDDKKRRQNDMKREISLVVPYILMIRFRAGKRDLRGLVHREVLGPTSKFETFGSTAPSPKSTQSFQFFLAQICLNLSQFAPIRPKLSQFASICPELLQSDPIYPQFAPSFFNLPNSLSASPIWPICPNSPQFPELEQLPRISPICPKLSQSPKLSQFPKLPVSPPHLINLIV